MLELTVGELVKKKREELNLTQAELAEMINSDPYYISRIENGKRKPGREYIALLSKALQVSADYLLGLSSDVVIHEHVTEMEKELLSLSDEDKEFAIKTFYGITKRCKEK